MLTIQLLGRPQVTRDGRPLTLARRKSRALLYYVAGQARPVPREHLLAVFWPDLDRRAAQQTLRTTLHGLRRALATDLLADDGALGLGPDVQVDAPAFEAAVTAPHAAPAALEAALAQYQGDFLDGFSLPDTPAFDDWAAAERERYRRLAVRALTALAAAQEAEGRYAAALETIDRALAFDALQEDLQRAALRLSYRAGDRAGAIRRYARLRQLLDEELGVLPMPETRALYDALLADTLPAGAAGESLAAHPAPLAPPARSLAPGAPAAAAEAAAPPPFGPTPIPFAGREAELAQLTALLATPPAARPLALLEGEPGIGKTRLAEEFLAASGPLALAAGAHELEQSLPYQPLIEALRQLLAQPAWPGLQAGLLTHLPAVWLAEVTRLLPELHPEAGAPAGAPDEPRLWEGLHQFLAGLARQHPLTLFIDDAQWADASTLAVLNYLHRRARAEGLPLLYVLAARPTGRRCPRRGGCWPCGRTDPRVAAASCACWRMAWRWGRRTRRIRRCASAAAGATPTGRVRCG